MDECGLMVEWMNGGMDEWLRVLFFCYVGRICTKKLILCAILFFIRLAKRCM